MTLKMRDRLMHKKTEREINMVLLRTQPSPYRQMPAEQARLGEEPRPAAVPRLYREAPEPRTLGNESTS